MNNILGPIQEAVPKLKHVMICQSAIEKFVANIQLSQLDGTEYNCDTILYGATEEEHITFPFVYDAMNFSYWGSPKWTIDIDSQSFDGSAAMIRAIKRGQEEINLLKADVLANLTKKDLACVLRGNVRIPLFNERLRLLNSLGRNIRDNFRSSFKSFVDSSDWDAEKLTMALVEIIPDVFDDTSTFHGHSIHFYKRAQLVSTHLYDLNKLNKIDKRMSNMNKLTAFADYKVPQLMRNMGILVYDDMLASKVDMQIELESGSEEEVEIRIATVWANELATKELKKRIPSATAAQVDGAIWFGGQNSKVNIKPYHRTRTIWY